MTKNLHTKVYYRAQIANLLALLIVICTFGYLFLGSLTQWLDGKY